MSGSYWPVLRISSNINNICSSILVLNYFMGNIRHWLRQHDHLHKLYMCRTRRGITSRLRGLPDFVIIGAQKCGTTSLYHFVVRHPAIVPAPHKELEYFTMKYRFGEQWYRSNFPTNLSRRRFYKKTGQKLLSGESSPTYIFYPMVSDRMKEILPDVKLIVILRNPVDRAYSHYHHNVRRNRETLPFEKAIELEGERCAGERERLIRDPDFVAAHYRKHSYLARGTYADQLEDWFKHYSKRQFLILATEDFRKNQQQTLDQVIDFLGLPPFKVENLTDRNVGNYKERMNEDTHKFLVEYFRPHNKRLYKLLQRDFDWDK